MNKKLLPSVIGGIIGLSATGLSSETFAVSLVIDGEYELRILTTPTRSTTYGGTVFDPVPVTGLESSFTWGEIVPTDSAMGMTDNNLLSNVSNDFSSLYGASAAPGAKGSSMIDGYAGLITFDVVGGNIQNATSFSVDRLPTIPGNFSQFIQDDDLSGFSGSIDEFGNMVFTPEGRLGAGDGPVGGFIGRWVIDLEVSGPGGVGTGDYPWSSFSTGSQSNQGSIINGTACSGAAGSYSCTLVNTGQVGTGDWGSAGEGNPFTEVWKIDLVRIGDATVVPVPAAIWLFGSGLIGLVGVARRKAARNVVRHDR